MNCPVLLQCRDEFIPNTKVVRNRSNTPDTQPTRVSDVHDTPGLIFPPSDTLSGNQPEPVLHPRMNSCSVQRVPFNVRALVTFHRHAFQLVVMLACIYCFFPP